VKNLIRVARPARLAHRSIGIGGARRRPPESLKSGRREAGLISRGPTGFRKDRPSRPPKLKSGEPPQRDRATADERVRGRARHAAPLGVPSRPERGKAQGSTDRRRNRPAAGDGWHGRVNAQKANAFAIKIGREESRSRVRFESGSSLVRFGGQYPDENQSGRLRRKVNDTWASVADNADGTVRPEQSCEGSNPKSGAGWRANHSAPATPARRRKIARAETGTPGTRKALPWRMSHGLCDPALRATVDAPDCVRTPNAPS
jgi:hypothetical protein